jgi:hypothetical protein
MAELVWDRRGRACGWLDGDAVRDSHGTARAFLVGEAVISYRGKGFLGSNTDRVFRDRRGRGVAFLDRAAGMTIPAHGVIPGKLTTRERARPRHHDSGGFSQGLVID